MKKMTIAAVDDVAGKTGTIYPAEFAEPVRDRCKRRLGDFFGLTQFGVNTVELPPGTWSAQRHWHTHEDEFIYVISGELTLVTDAGEQNLTAGMVAGFPASVADGHHLVNRSDHIAQYLEIGARHPDDTAYYPDIDLEAHPDGAGGREFRRRDGSPVK